MNIPRFAKVFEGYETVDFKEFLAEGRIEIHLKAYEDKKRTCYHCGTELGAERGHHRVKLESLPIGGIRSFIYFLRFKGHCPKCKKARSEFIPFIAKETPHLTQDYAWWIGRICEIAPVSRVAELVSQDKTTTWRVDFRRMRRMLMRYKIPEGTEISVDEVYARKKPRYEKESRDFFTVISDLRTHRVIWVSEGRSKRSLDLFFLLLGEELVRRSELLR